MKNKTVAFGANLKMLRKKAGYTRVTLAEIISYSEKSIEKWESGGSVPPVETLCRLSELFGVTLDALVYAPDTKIKYLLAIDGGGTNTEFILTDLNKKEIASLSLGSSNAADVGMENAQRVLENGIRQVCRGINLREVSVFAGLSGSTAGDNKEKIREFLSKFNFGLCDNDSDTESILELALQGGDGVAVIMGVDISAFAQKDGKRHRIGGWGTPVDRLGSGYSISLDAIYSALKYIDGREGSAVLKELIEKKLGRGLEKAVSDILSGGKAYIALLAPLVFEAYDMGDKYAIDIIDKNIKEVAEMITVGLENISAPNSKVVFLGSLGKRKDILMPVFRKHIGEDVNITFNNRLSADGALMLADKLRLQKEGKI